MEELGTTQCYPDEPDRNTSASTNDIDAGLAAAPKQLRQNIIFYQWAHNFFFPRSCSDLATWIYSHVLLHRREPRPMSDSSTKKRKRALLAVEDEEPQHRQKTQVVETEDTDGGMTTQELRDNVSVFFAYVTV